MSIERVLIADEGLRLKPYRCTAGKLTIGIGRNLDDRGITEEEARFILSTDIAEARAFAKECFPKFQIYGDARQAAIISLIFNLGKSGFLRFRGMLDAIRREDWTEAASEAADSLWFRQVKKRGPRIIEMLADDTFPDYYRLP